MGWQDDAACVGTTLDWFSRSDEEACLDVCRACPVQVACLLAAREEETSGPKAWVAGVRGGLTAEQRIDAHLADGRSFGRVNAARCGTFTGYQRHLDAGTEPCGPCRDAMREQSRRPRRRTRS